MEPKDSRPRTPSLLADNAPPTSGPVRSGTLTDEADAAEATPAAGPRARSSRWRVPVVVGILALLVIAVLVYAFAGDDTSRPTSGMPSNAAVAHPGMAASDVSDDGVAVILPGPARDDSSMTATQGGRSDLAASLLANPSTAGAGKSTSVQGELAERISGKRARPRRRAASRPRKTDSDVALLTALIQHVENGGPGAWEKAQKAIPQKDPLEIKMKKCPRANTEAGLQCRKKICEGHAGESPACPAPTGKD